MNEDVRYTALDTPMHGRLFRDPSATGPQPGVLVFPEGFGISEHTYGIAEKLAALGYVALAADLYGEGFFHNGPSADIATRNAKITADPARMQAVGRSAFDLLAARPEVDAGRIAACGHCFGGTVATALAFSGAPVAAVASLHPSFRGLDLDRAANARCPIHLFVGAEDYAAPPAARAGFEAVMAGTGVRWRMTVYGGVKHGFTNPDCEGMGEKVAYDAEADADSWAQMTALFAAAFAAGRV